MAIPYKDIHNSYGYTFTRWAVADLGEKSVDNDEKETFLIRRVSGAPVTDEDLLTDLIDVARLEGSNTVGQKVYREKGKYDDSTVSRRFGSWNKALEKAGLDKANRVNISDDALFKNILTLWQHFGRQPRRAELAHPPSTISQTPYSRRFASWGKALDAFVEWANAGDEDVGQSVNKTTNGNKPKTGRDPSLRLRFRVLSRDNFTCQNCGASPAKDPKTKLHVDHVKPWSKGGETTIENLQTLCSDCNLGKGDMIVP